MKYEFYYNWDYALRNNPRLMCIGTTGGFGGIRAAMIDAVYHADRYRAEEMFWCLIDQTKSEMHNDLEEVDISLEQGLEDWFREVLEGDPHEQWDEIRHFMRIKGAMSDSRLDLYPDPMVIPTLSTPNWIIKDNTSYARELRDFIEWMHNDPCGDPMDPGAIY